jgi:hypothetical protein
MSNRVPDQDFAFYCDESGISNDRYTVVGGLCVHRSNVQEMIDTIAAFRTKHNMFRELKWTKITNDKASAYLDLVNYFFALNNNNRCHFHSVIFDSHQWNHNKYNNGDSDIGLSKLYYQVIHHKVCRTCAPHGSIFVRVDHRNSSTSLNDLRGMLNAAALRDYGLSTNPIKSVESCDSKACDILQMNDVILGAVCAARNGKHILEATRPAKRKIASLVLEKSGLNSFDKDSPRHINRITIWNFRAGK